MPGAAPQRLRILRLCKILLTACAAAVLLFLPFAGRFFSAADPLQRGDAIVVLAGSRVDRWLEAVDLFKEGWAPRVVLSPGPVSDLEVKLRGEGLRLPREGDLARDAVLSLGVPADAVTVMPGGVDNTAAEAAALRRWLPPGSHRVIVVTSTTICGAPGTPSDANSQAPAPRSSCTEAAIPRRSPRAGGRGATTSGT